MSGPLPPRTRLNGLLVAEAQALLEGPQPGQAAADARAGAPGDAVGDDTADLAEAHRAATTLEARAIERAWRRAARNGLLADLAALRGGAGLAAVASALLVAASAAAMLGAVVGEGRSINVVLAFVALLGLHGVTLLGWLLSLVVRRPGPSGIGRWLLAAVRRTGGPRRAALVAAAGALLGRGGVQALAFGAFSHAVWSAAFVVVLAGLFAAFSFQAFRLGWETTLLDAQDFAGFVAAAGRWPALLGFPAVDQGTLAAAADGGRHRLLAWWLIGCTVGYGLLPRVVLGAGCAVLARRRLRALALDPSAPWLRRLATRFAQLDRSMVIDVEHAAPRPAGAVPAGPVPAGGRLALIGFELPPEAPWPPPALAAHATLVLQVDGSAAACRQALDALQHGRITTVVVVVNAAATPDRGTEQFLLALQAPPRHVALLLQDVPPARANEPRWRGWLQHGALPGLPLHAGAAAALAWAGHG